MTIKNIFHVWWPLAISWLMISVELPLISAFITRLDNPEIALASYGGIVYPIVLFISSPIIVLLPASTALSKNWEAYQKLRSFMVFASFILTFIHCLIAFTPLYYFIVGEIIKVPEEIIYSGKIGMMILTPFIISVAYRRFNQGILIRFGYSQLVTIGTIIRFASITFTLIVGSFSKQLDGIIVATGALSLGVLAEAIYIAFIIQPIINKELKIVSLSKTVLSWGQFSKFYIPLALTALLLLVVQPFVVTALSRMPDALNSLVVWPVVLGLAYIVRSGGMAITEMVLASLEKPNSVANLRRFTISLATVYTIIIVIISLSSLSRVWFINAQGLRPDLARLASHALLLTIPIPALTVIQGFHQGILLFEGHTKALFESVVLFLITLLVVLLPGIILYHLSGIYYGVLAMTVAGFIQVIWLTHCSIPKYRLLIKRDSEKIIGFVND